MRPLELPGRVLRNRNGVALPIAMLGLIVITLLVIGAIVTSGAEAETSFAHQRATGSLYRAEAAVQEYVAGRASAGLLHPATEGFQSGGDAFAMSVGRLSQRELETADSLFLTETFSVTAEPSSGRGRATGAFLTTLRKLPKFNLTVESGLTVGGSLSVSGTSAISDGSNGHAVNCDSTASPYAVQVTHGSTLSVDGNAKITGATDTATFTNDQMVSQLLGGMTLQEAARYATIKFDPLHGMFDPATHGKPRSYDKTTPRDTTNRYNWGCPKNSGDDCVALGYGGSNVHYYPSVAIDANGGMVAIDGHHGQGVLIVYNGGAELKGNFIFEGIVLIEGDMVIQGSSSGGVKLQGVVLALGKNSSVTDNLSGNAVVTYNRCIINQAKDAFNKRRVQNAPQSFGEPTRSWFEVVR